MKKHLPPPTKFGPGAMVQAKGIAGGPAAGPPPPPATRYGAPGAVQAKPMPKPHAGPPPVGAIQMSREKMEQEHDFVLVPSDDSVYRRHVRDRIRHCVLVLKRLSYFQVWAKGQGTTKSMSSMVSKNAEVQVATGIYTQSIKMDAAHLMNISIRPDALKSGLALTTQQEAAVEELQKLSGATTPQLKSNNTGPDKVIDRCMSEFRSAVEQSWATGVPDTRVMINYLGTLCLGKLRQSKKSGNANYQAAIAGVQDAMQGTVWEIDEDCAIWAKSYGFV